MDAAGCVYIFMHIYNVRVATKEKEAMNLRVGEVGWDVGRFGGRKGNKNKK